MKFQKHNTSTFVTCTFKEYEAEIKMVGNLNDDINRLISVHIHIFIFLLIVRPDITSSSWNQYNLDYSKIPHLPFRIVA